MNFRIADTFTDSLARLTSEEQKLVKTTAFDLQKNPVNPGMAFHKIGKSKDKNFWSVRVCCDSRLIVQVRCAANRAPPATTHQLREPAAIALATSLPPCAAPLAGTWSPARSLTCAQAAAKRSGVSWAKPQMQT